MGQTNQKDTPLGQVSEEQAGVDLLTISSSGSH